MTQLTRTLWAAATIGATLLTAGGWCASLWSDASDAAAAATADLAACQSTAGRIELLRDRPGATTAAMTVAALSRRVAAVIDDLGIDSHGQGRVVPQPPRPTADPAFQEVPAAVTLHRVSLRQALGFAAAIAPPGSGLAVRGLHLSEPVPDPGDKVGDDEWDAEVTVAYRVAAAENRPSAGP